MTELEKKDLADKIVSWSTFSSHGKVPGVVIERHFTKEDREKMKELTSKDFNHRIK